MSVYRTIGPLVNSGRPGMEFWSSGAINNGEGHSIFYYFFLENQCQSCF